MIDLAVGGDRVERRPVQIGASTVVSKKRMSPSKPSVCGKRSCVYSRLERRVVECRIFVRVAPARVLDQRGRRVDPGTAARHALEACRRRLRARAQCTRAREPAVRRRRSSTTPIDRRSSITSTARSSTASSPASMCGPASSQGCGSWRTAPAFGWRVPPGEQQAQMRRA